jgi:sec-independent protein translocase protein TatA
MLGFDNPIHIAFVLVLLLLVFGAKRLPEMGRSLGSGLRGFKESISGEHDPAQHLTATQPPAMTVAQPQPQAVPVGGLSAASTTDAAPVAANTIAVPSPVAERVS